MQGDLISRSAAFKAAELINWYHVNQNGKLVSGSTSDDESYVKFDDVISMLKDAPALDAVPVVRCKDCKNYDVGMWCADLERGTAEEFFCAKGEKKC